eukprot:TRINITY_DN60380_c0_g1_i1.p1 TRINITY_DN60380_c0_g1~~TRINITY_DN60380_c0_g1_i1.p1  ORF type:complete len:429 (-),score=83.35 TRINITY_DN60380_c0_g1_i1:89-1312(-)
MAASAVASGVVSDESTSRRRDDLQAKAAADPSVPRKRINSPQDLEVFLSSRLFEQFISFAGELSEAVKGKAQDPSRLASAAPLIKGLVQALDEVESWIRDFPPLQQPMRFGNKAFRQWHERVVERSAELLSRALRPALPEDPGRADRLAGELSYYFLASFGDERRIDYGTGHEATFFAIIYALGSQGLLQKADAADAVLLVFGTYMRVMRKLQTVYVLEPAGSHGVWGLDDFHALPFLFGAAQLIGMEDDIPTGQVYKDNIIKEHADGYLYVDAIRQVLLAKKGAPFHETSPMLYDITAVPTWQKIHAGLVRMYRAEVLGKYPVIQHFLFGPLIPWPGDHAGQNVSEKVKAPVSTTMPPPPVPAKVLVGKTMATAAPWKTAGENGAASGGYGTQLPEPLGPMASRPP